jgi:hypothetical protein
VSSQELAFCGAANLLTLTNASAYGSGVTYNWYKGNDRTSLGSGTTYSATSVGTYYVEAQDANCLSSSPGIDLRDQGTRPNVTASANTPVCKGNPLQFTSGASGGKGSQFTYSWTGPNAYTSNEQSPAIEIASVSDTGTYQLKVTNEFGCTGTAIIPVEVTNCSIPINPDIKTQFAKP